MKKMPNSQEQVPMEFSTAVGIGKSMGTIYIAFGDAFSATMELRDARLIANQILGAVKKAEEGMKAAGYIEHTGGPVA